MADYTLIDNSQAAKDELHRKIEVALEAVGLQAEGYIKAITPVDTGNLRRSITHVVATSEQAAYVGTNVEYAAYVELGTSKQKPQPYVKPGVERHVKEYQEILNTYLNSQ